jgi:hypothetical protein
MQHALVEKIWKKTVQLQWPGQRFVYKDIHLIIIYPTLKRKWY